MDPVSAPNDIFLSRNVPQPVPLAIIHDVPGDVRSTVKYSHFNFFQKHLHIPLGWIKRAAKEIIHVTVFTTE